MRALVSCSNGISKWSGKFLIYLIIPMFCVPIAESIIFRLLLNRPTIWGLETTLFIYGGYFVLGGAYCHLFKRHVSMDLLYKRLPLRGRAVIDIIICLIIFLFCGVILWFGGKWAWNATMIGEKAFSAWAPYIWPIRWTVPVGAGLLAIQALGDLILAIQTLVSGKEIKT